MDLKIKEIRTGVHTNSVTSKPDGIYLVGLCDNDSIHMSTHHPHQHGNRKPKWRCISESFPDNKNIIGWEFAVCDHNSITWMLFALCEDGSVWKRDQTHPWVELKDYP